MIFLECSAKTGYNVDILFETISLAILKKIEQGEINPRDESGGIKIGVNEPQILHSKHRSCC
jgi:Ras-related protein Rab-2A